MKKYAFMSANIAGFLIVYIVSRQFFQDVYLPEWTRRNAYLYVWIAVIFFDFLEKYFRSVSISVGNIVGIVVGQVAGDAIVRHNIQKIRPEMLPGKIEQLRSHPGVLIWICTILMFYVVGTLLEKAKERRIS